MRDIVAAAYPLWLQPDGMPVACRNKLKTLDGNLSEVRQIIRDAFEDAVLMGVDEDVIRRSLLDAVNSLQSPRRK